MTGPFRILDLAAELRNNIYEHALTHDRSNGITATVGLLRTCRQVYNESKAIFYAQSTATIIIRLSPREREQATSVSVAGDMTNASILREPAIALFRGLPQHIAEVPRIDIQLDFQFAKRPYRPSHEYDAVNAVSRFLYALVDLLNANGRPRRVDISSKRPICDRMVFDLDVILSPLRRMQQHIDLHLQDDMSLEACALLDGMPARLYLDPLPPLLSEFLLLDRHIQSMGWPLDTAAHRYGYERFRKVEHELYAELGHLSHTLHDYLALQFILARGLLGMNTRKELADIVHPPEWLVACVRSLEKRELKGNMAPKEFLRMHLKPLEHLIDAIPDEK